MHFQQLTQKQQDSKLLSMSLRRSHLDTGSLHRFNLAAFEEFMEVTATQSWPSLWIFDSMQQKPQATDKDLKKRGRQLLGMKVKGTVLARKRLHKRHTSLSS